ncbi:MAG: YggT family protein [Patescibacteria group bacterium]
MGANLLTSLINFVLGVIELLVGLRFVLKLFNAGLAPAVNWVYGTSQPLVAPFVGMFPNPVLNGGFMIEFASLIALIIYALIGYLLGKFVATIAYRARRRVVVEE